MIMKTLLAKEKVAEGLDFKELATMTEGYSGSDLKVHVLTLSYGVLADNRTFYPTHQSLLFTELVHDSGIPTS